MTCIVACVDEQKGKLVFGGDSAVTEKRGRIYSTTTPKVRRAGGYLIGAAGESLWFALLNSMRWPVVPSIGYMEGPGFINDLYSAASKLGLSETDIEGDLLVGAAIEGSVRLWRTDPHGAVDSLPATDFAIGSGGEAARAALLVLHGTPRKRALAALHAAAHVRVDVRGPFVLVNN